MPPLDCQFKSRTTLEIQTIQFKQKLINVIKFAWIVQICIMQLVESMLVLNRFQNMIQNSKHGAQHLIYTGSSRDYQSMAKRNEICNDLCVSSTTKAFGSLGRRCRKKETLLSPNYEENFPCSCLPWSINLILFEWSPYTTTIWAKFNHSCYGVEGCAYYDTMGSHMKAIHFFAIV